MSQHRTLGSDTPALSGVRTFIVPPDIVAVPRRSPVPVRKRTPWTPRPDGEDPVDRTGGRDWFGEHLSSHAARPRSSGIFAASAVVNAAAVLLVAVLMMSRRDVLVPERHQPLYVRVALALGSPVAPETTAPAPPQAAPPAPASAPAPKAEEPAVAIESTPAAPVEAPAEIRPEPLTPPPTGPVGSALGVPDGGANRAATGTDGPNGGGGAAAGSGQAPMRLGGGIQPPRKVKDVKPVYPPDAMSGQLRGTVVIEATISAEGRVVNAVVRRAIAGLDQAALEAVRQWEYEPARLNGVAVAVIMTVTVAFSIL
jgi:periplasmic protein TonB